MIDQLVLAEGEYAEILYAAPISKEAADYCNANKKSDCVEVYEIKNENLETVAFEVHTPYTITRHKDRFQALCLALIHLSTEAVNFEKETSEEFKS